MEELLIEKMGCFCISSSSVLVGDPMLGRGVSAVYSIINVHVGRWCVLQQRKQGERRRIIVISENFIPYEKKILACRIGIETISGYIGIFDKIHYQAGNDRRCSKWFRYCQRSIIKDNDLGFITGGFVMYKTNDDNELQCNVYQNSKGVICCFIVEE